MMTEKANLEDISNIENSLLTLDKLVRCKYAFPNEKALYLQVLLEDIRENMNYLQPNIKIYEQTKEENIPLNIRREIKNELKNEFKKELKTKSPLNLCIEDDFLQFMDQYCDIGKDKMIQASRLTRLYNNITGSDVTVRRIGKIMKYVTEKRDVHLKLKRDGTYYCGFDIKKEYLDENDNIVTK